jgi:hypothetical protein
MRTFEEKAHEVLPLIITVCKAFKETSYCDKFLKLLQIVLAIGNYLNGNTSNGRAYGFKLEVLLKVIGPPKYSVTPKCFYIFSQQIPHKKFFSPNIFLLGNIFSPTNST